MNTDASITPRSDIRTQGDVTGPARVFVAAAPQVRTGPEWTAICDALRRRLPGAELVTHGWLSSCAGMVIVPKWDLPDFEIGVAARVGMPVVVLARHGLAALSERTIGEVMPPSEGYPNGVRSIAVPSSRTASPALVSALTAMGALPVRGRR